jgi:hypothetical protein
VSLCCINTSAQKILHKGGTIKSHDLASLSSGQARKIYFCFTDANMNADPCPDVRCKARNTADIDIALLQAEGADINAVGGLIRLDRFWDFSQKCKLAYKSSRVSSPPLTN